MSEFKGTKGEWGVIRMDDTFIETSEGNICEIPHNGVYNYDELPYNALLISKAPKMLEMLQYIVNEVEKGQILDVEDLFDIKQLIKQVTEL